jgi:chemotaxis protein MotB
MSAPVAPTIIIIKKKGGSHGGHHGGAWKVAYADFVTAMMALFIVLWLLSSSAEVQQAVSGYFRDPKGFGKQMGSNVGGQGETLIVTKTNLNQLKEKLEAAIRQTPQLDKIKNHVQMTITGDGLRIELIESDKGTFFESGEAVPTPAGTALLVEIAHQFNTMPNSVLIEGHTDAKPFDSTKYSNWELSADRANASRRIMQENGLRSNQVSQVRGFADQQLRLPAKPDDASNRRVTIIVQYPQALAPPEEPKGKAGAKGTGEKGEGHVEKKEH